jgi:hypothetical protein
MKDPHRLDTEKASPFLARCLLDPDGRAWGKRPWCVFYGTGLWRRTWLNRDMLDQ